MKHHQPKPPTRGRSGARRRDVATRQPGFVPLPMLSRRMRTATIGSLCVVLLSGCTPFRSHSQRNQFAGVAADDISRISLCHEEKIWGENPILGGPAPVEIYLRPYGAEIRDRETIHKMWKALRGAKVSSGYPKTGSGLLSYQVFFDKDNRILATTSIENHQCGVAFSRCAMTRGSMKYGWISFMPNDNAFLGCQSVQYCRLVFDFMKRELPEVIAKWDRIHQTRGGIEKQLFDGVE